MATLVIGDVQGCDVSLGRLLDRARFDPSRDRLWLTGDLVNRGPASAAVLRRLRALGDAVVAVLGNHDLHLLAASLGLRETRPRDSLRDVLEAPDAAELLAWLRLRPLLHREGRHVLVHAGLAPSWTPEDAEALAREVEDVVRGPGLAELLQTMTAATPRRWDDALTGFARHATAAAFLTRLRTCRQDGEALFEFTGPPAAAPPGFVPWFEVPGRRSGDVTVLFGHWAALGLHRAPGVVALDSGCVWGRELTALHLEDGRILQEPCADSLPSVGG